ncbi:hypothetical protein HPB48_018111 [Haemaphysalis longicornis]|uniref:Cullin family profile domain-containing protein n=1 Tax=Haemaphysalis longicornis TaxID=44386 RepID=A0A9J6FWA0_HAELO|nr:hypothetical protein HPB48_018111 [Haemaphysalis longicornis]
MFRLVSRTTHGLEQLRSSFQEHVLQEGLSAIERVGEEAAKDPGMYVNALLHVHGKYKDLVVTTFGSDGGFFSALEAACRRFVNSNFVTRRPKPRNGTPELLAQYCDSLLLKSRQKSEVDDLEEALDAAILLLRFTDDKDVFKVCYSKMLTMRLLRKTSVSEGAETMMISRLKEVYGNGYTMKLERMIQDIRVSKVLNDNFNKTMKNTQQSLEHGFTAFVLNSGSWPFQASPAVSLPRSLNHSIQSFTRYYLTAHPSRKLTWLYHISEGELATTCFRRPYILRASTMHMVVLLQYNDSLSFTMQHLQEATGISTDMLHSVLKAMLEEGLLSLKDQEQDVQKHQLLPPDAVLSLNTEFSNAKLLVDIRARLNTDAKVQKDADEATIKAERKTCIQAAIVRVMKNRGMLKREQIVANVIDLLSCRFKPDVECIKECIEHLVKKEYLEKAEGEEDTYIYLA